MPTRPTLHQYKGKHMHNKSQLSPSAIFSKLRREVEGTPRQNVRKCFKIGRLSLALDYGRPEFSVLGVSVWFNKKVFVHSEWQGVDKYYKTFGLNLHLPFLFLKIWTEEEARLDAKQLKRVKENAEEAYQAWEKERDSIYNKK